MRNWRFALVMNMALACAVLGSPRARAQDEIDRLDMKAHAAYDTQDYDSAIKLWGEVLKLDPKNANASYNRASAYELAKQPDKAIEGYTEAIQLDPTDPASHISRARIYAGRWYTANSKGQADDDDAEKMLADYNELVRLKPEAQSYLVRASAYRTLKKFDKAIDDYNEIIKLDPKSVEAYEYRGATYVSQAQWDKAIADFTQAIQLDANNAPAYQFRGQAYIQKGEWDKAIDDANSALKVNPDNPEAAAMRGNAYASKGLYDKAIEDYHNITASDPGFAEAYNAEAWLYATCPKDEIRNGAKALELAQKACDLTEFKDASFIDTLAAAEAEAGKFDDAVKHQQQAVDAGKAALEADWQIKDYASRIELYQQKKPYREKAPPPQ